MNTTTNPDQIATFTNRDMGIASLVTQTKKGYAVTLLDTDAEMIVGYVKIYPFDMMVQAIKYAKALANV